MVKTRIIFVCSLLLSMLESERRSAHALAYSGEWAASSKRCPEDEQLGPAAQGLSPPGASVAARGTVSPAGSVAAAQLSTGET